MSTCGAENESLELMNSLLVGEDVPIPVYDPENPEFDLPGNETNPLYGEIQKFSIGELTTRVVGGSGSFDALMEGVKIHLKEEFDKNRITGAEYAKAYIALTQAAIGGAVQYLLGKDQAYWASVQAQVAAITGRIQMRLATTELAVVHYKAKTMKAEYALSKMKLSTESVNYCIAQYQLDTMLPMQHSKLSSEKIGQDIQNDTGLYQLNSILPMQLQTMVVEKTGKEIQNATGQYQLSSILPMQLLKTTAEKDGQIIQNNTGQYQLDSILPMQLQKMNVEKAGLEIQNDTGQYQLDFMLPMELEKKTVEKETGQYQLSFLLPMQLNKLTSEWDGQEIQNNTVQYQLDFTLPMQLQKLTSERDGQIVQNAGILVTNAVNTYNLENILPQQKAKLIAEELMTKEQTEVQRAQTLDTRTDGVGILGSVGKQKALYDQQIISYRRDAEHKAAKLFTDAWITQKTLDEGLPAPSGFTNASLDGVLNTIKANNNLA